MRVSVIIPTWNRAGRLVRAIASVRTQTIPAHEIIIVDDGSKDDTRRVVRNRFPEVRYHYQRHTGVSGARNAGLRMASGDWIALLDSDDEWQPRKLERQLQALQKQPNYRICHSDEIWIRRGRRVNPMKKHAKRGGWIFRYCLPRCVISPSSVIMCRELINRVGPFDESLPACEDYDLWLRVCSIYPALYLDEPLITKHGGHQDQLSLQYWGMDRFRVHALAKILDAGVLSGADRHAALQTILGKIRIIRQGAEKRNNRQLATEYRDKEKYYLTRLAACDAHSPLALTGTFAG
jgi:glycosyltransferase involved in cell wall biosynthesis